MSRSTFRPEIGTMVPTLSLRSGDFTLADAGSLAVPTPECPMALGPGGSEAAVNGFGLALGPFSGNRSNHDSQRRRRVSAAPPRSRPRGVRRGARR
jgi:hypothetical protein